MSGLEHPKLKCTQSGAVIELNCNPFSIGRGLSCNFVVIKKPVSRVHCIFEKDEQGWILRDTSTNGSFVNGFKLDNGVKSSPLKDGDVIRLDMEGEEYIFQMGERNQSDDISDEQLCSIADSVLNEVEAFQHESRHQDDNGQFRGNSNENVTNMDMEPVTSAALQDHLGMAKTIDSHLSKKLKTEMGPSIASTAAAEVGTSNAAAAAHPIDLTANSDTSSTSISPEKQEPTSGTDKVPPDVTSTSDIKVSEKPIKPPQAAGDTDKYEVMEDELQCAICSELFVKAVTLQCSHTFCKYCIEMWKKNKSECPICRKKITAMTATLVLDNVIEKVIEGSSKETQQRRNQMLEERKLLEKPIPPAAPAPTGRGRGRGRGGRRRNSPTVVYGVVGDAVQMGSVSEHVIEVSSDSNSDWDDSSDSNSDDTTEWRDEYDNDDWYDEGVPGTYYGGYGHCYCCGRQGHWANGCPYR